MINSETAILLHFAVIHSRCFLLHISWKADIRKIMSEDFCKFRDVLINRVVIYLEGHLNKALTPNVVEGSLEDEEQKDFLEKRFNSSPEL